MVDGLSTIIGKGAVRHRRRPLVVNAAAMRQRAAVQEIFGNGAVRECQSATGVEEAAAAAVGGVVRQSAACNLQRAIVVDGAAVERKIVGEGNAGQRQRAEVVNATAIVVNQAFAQGKAGNIDIGGAFPYRSLDEQDAAGVMGIDFQLVRARPNDPQVAIDLQLAFR